MKPCVGTEEWAVGKNRFKGVTCRICTHHVIGNKRPICDNCLVGERFISYINLINLLEKVE